MQWEELVDSPITRPSFRNQESSLLATSDVHLTGWYPRAVKAVKRILDAGHLFRSVSTPSPNFVWPTKCWGVRLILCSNAIPGILTAGVAHSANQMLPTKWVVALLHTNHWGGKKNNYKRWVIEKLFLHTFFMKQKKKNTNTFFFVLFK